MGSSSSKQSRSKFYRKRSNILLGNRNETEAENGAVPQQGANVPSLSNDENISSLQMFGGDNIAISGGQFIQARTMIQNVKCNRAKAFKLLQKRVATSAFHNSAQRVDPPRCHPDTRVEIMQKIFKWIIQSERREEWLLWLNGAAGAGKSSIMQSIADRCVLEAMAMASFFFLRSDSTRNTMAPLIATLAYQLIQIIPEASDDILLTIDRNPLIFDQSLESQLQQLIIQPLLRLPSHVQRVFVIIIDGLDECTGRTQQSSLIKLLGSVSCDEKTPVVFVISSRREPQIEAAFKQKPVSELVMTLPLDNSDIEQTFDDIRRFLTDKFKETGDTHLRQYLLPTNWPPPAAVEEIITKSSGQFIYAAVVMNFISSPHTNPAHQLDIVRGIRLRCGPSQNPFAHLDALYQHMFSQVEDIEKVLDILGFILLTNMNHIHGLELLFRMMDGELEVYFSDLIAIVQCGPSTDADAEITFLHASLPDFLRDKSRSEEYHIDLDEYRTKLLCMLLERPSPLLDPLFDLSSQIDLEILYNREMWRLDAIRDLVEKAKVSDRLQSAFLSFDFVFTEIRLITTSILHYPEILKFLKQLEFDDQSLAYRYVLEVFAVGFVRYWHFLDDDDQEKVRIHSPDLLDRISYFYEEGFLRFDTDDAFNG